MSDESQKKEEHFKGKVALKGVIEHAGTVLLMRDVRETREIWEIPGGRMNLNESPREALARELKEELGVECDVHEAVYITQFWQHSDQAHALMIAFRATLADPEAVFSLEASEVAEVVWCTLEEALQRELFPEYRATLEAHMSRYDL